MPRSNRISGKSLTTRCGGKGLAQECAAEPQALAVDAVPDPLRHVPLDRKAGMGELFAGEKQGVDGNDLVHVAMNKQDRGRRSRVLG
jgi:hypothetical protein